MKGGGTILNYEQNKNEPGSYRKLWLLNDSFWEPGWESKFGRAVRRSHENTLFKNIIEQT